MTKKNCNVNQIVLVTSTILCIGALLYKGIKKNEDGNYTVFNYKLPNLKKYAKTTNIAIKKKFNIETSTEDDVIELLNEALESQSLVKEAMEKSLTDLSTEQKDDIKYLYNYIIENYPQDVLARHGVNQSVIDLIIDKYNYSMRINELLLKLVYSDNAPASNMASDNLLSTEKITEIINCSHNYLQASVELLKTEIDKKIRSPYYDMLCLQLIIAAKVAEKFNVSTADVERAALYHKEELKDNEDYLSINESMQRIFNEISKEEIQ